MIIMYFKYLPEVSTGKRKKNSEYFFVTEQDESCNFTDKQFYIEYSIHSFRQAIS